MAKKINLKSLKIETIVVYLAVFFITVWGFELLPTQWLEQFTARVSSIALKSLGFSSGWEVQGIKSYLRLTGGVRDVSVTIIRECTGIQVFAILTGMILPVNGGLWLRKALSLTASGLLLLILNISRVMLTVLLTAFDIAPFSWIFTNPTIESYHYPLSFIYGLFGVSLIFILISGWLLPELGETVIGIISFFKERVQIISTKMR